MKKIYMVMDMQFGSTGKGLLAGYLAMREQPDVVMTAWGPNAGHTYIDESGRKFVHCMLANGVVSPKLKTILIGPGSVIDLDRLAAEISQCRDLLKHNEIVIHPQAAVVTQAHRDIEQRNVKIGSTMKGTGAAVIERIERDPDNNPTAIAQISPAWLSEIRNMEVEICVDAGRYDDVIRSAEVIQVEGAQGYSLSIYHGMYPYTTSRDVTPAQVMADCAIPFSMVPEVYGTLRTYPIRVSNRKSKGGDLIGTSGPWYPDQIELDWEKDMDMKPELTTVTQLPRRIFTFSFMQLNEASFRCAPTKLFLNFANYMPNDDVEDLIHCIERVSGSKVAWVGIGPADDDVIERDEWMVTY
jgi:adenylosuccinate synthase